MDAFIPASATADARRVLTARAIRAFADGYAIVPLPFYLTVLGLGPVAVGTIATATLLGSAALSIGVGLLANRLRRRPLLRAAAFLMALTGAGFAGLSDFWLLLVVAAVSTLTPSSGSVFQPLEHTVLAQSVAAGERTALFARYSLIAALLGAVGSLASGSADLLALVVEPLTAARLLFGAYAGFGLWAAFIYRGLLPEMEAAGGSERQAPLGPSRRRVWGLAALFSLDSFASGLVANSMLTLWLYQRFDLSAAAAGLLFAAVNLGAAFSFLVAERLAARIGLINTMVYTHIPANLFLIGAAFAPSLAWAVVFLIARGLLSQMDVPARTSYVMAVVEPAERPAAASLTNVPRSLAAAPGPALAGAMLAATSFGWPLVACGVLKIVYDLSLLAAFRRVKPPEER
ncbi:MAG: MFS transporter [Alphaproteobacteria bacterium]|nr:MFS transporter [Alphaproteobacteria bacterium]